MTTLKSFLLAVWSVIVFAAGVFFTMKFDKPDTVVNNNVGKVKGQGNTVTNEPATTFENTEKNKFRLFGKKKKNQ